MADHTHIPDASTESVVKTIRWCHWHGDVTDTGVLISAEESASTGPRPVYACTPCRVKHRLVPLAEKPL